MSRRLSRLTSSPLVSSFDSPPDTHTGCTRNVFSFSLISTMRPSRYLDTLVAGPPIVLVAECEDKFEWSGDVGVVGVGVDEWESERAAADDPLVFEWAVSL